MEIDKRKLKHSYLTFLSTMGCFYIGIEIFGLFGMESNFIGGFFGQLFLALVLAIMIKPRDIEENDVGDS